MFKYLNMLFKGLCVFVRTLPLGLLLANYSRALDCVCVCVCAFKI